MSECLCLKARIKLRKWNHENSHLHSNIFKCVDMWICYTIAYGSSLKVDTESNFTKISNINHLLVVLKILCCSFSLLFCKNVSMYLQLIFNISSYHVRRLIELSKSFHLLSIRKSILKRLFKGSSWISIMPFERIKRKINF